MNRNQNVVSIRLRSEEADVLRAAAEAEGSTVAQFMRGAAGREALARLPGAARRTLPSGAELVIA